ncbi:MAG: EthD domain-containing protein, partial [Pseudomonadota bacterium]
LTYPLRTITVRVRLGEDRRMLTMTFCLHRLPSLSQEEFSEYWFEKHAPVVASVRDALKIQRYVQFHGAMNEIDEVLRATRGSPEGYDGVAQLWWESVETFEAAAASPEGLEAGMALLEDEQKFIDLTRSPIFVKVGREIF